ncbi:MAG: cyclic nucleotide-binding domain-containing protein [Terracidiphilus sp.]
MQTAGRGGGCEPAARPLAELLACPPATASLLEASAQSISFAGQETIFDQGADCRGLYLVISGELMRRADRLETHLNLGLIRAGNLVELAAALGDGRHTYTLMALAPGSLLLLPRVALEEAFHAHPPLRMRLLEELACEVSRAYALCCAARMAGGRRHRMWPSAGHRQLD